jgi:hypothetical protein
MNQDTLRGAGRWSTVRYAIDDWGRTIRLCLILIVLSVPPAGRCVAGAFSALAFIQLRPIRVAADADSAVTG